MTSQDVTEWWVRRLIEYCDQPPGQIHKFLPQTNGVFSTIRVMCKRWTLVVAFHISSVHKTMSRWWVACRITHTQRCSHRASNFHILVCVGDFLVVLLWWVYFWLVFGFVLFDGGFITVFWPATVHFWWPLNLRTAMYMHQLTLHPNLKHAIERVERPGGSHEGVGRKTMTSSSIVWAARGQSAWKSTSLRHQFHALVWIPVASFHFTWPKHSWIHLLASAGTAPAQTKKTLSHLDLSNRHLLDRPQRGIPVMKKDLGAPASERLWSLDASNSYRLRPCGTPFHPCFLWAFFNFWRIKIMQIAQQTAE